MATYTVYHTTEHRGNHEEIIHNGGVYGDSTDLFLGKGYYYWENNFDEAKNWGIKRYKGNSFIFCGKFNFDLERMFDLSLNEHILYIQKLQKKLSVKKKGVGDLKIGVFIDFLIDFQNEQLEKGEITDEELFFPFWYSKGLDETDVKTENLERFSIRVGHYYNVKPLVFFCVYKKDYINLTDFTLVRTLGSNQNTK